MPANEPAAGGAAPGGEGGRAAVLTDAQLAEIERMLSRVSEWPWEEVELDPGDYRVMGRRRGNYRPCVADVMQSEHDSAFIAEAPAYVSALLATVRALRDELEEARREREKAKDAEAHFAILAECRRNDLRVADELLAAWKGAITDAGVVAWTLRPEHEHDPRAAVNALLAHAQQVALDPAVSSEARDLHDRLASAERAAREAGERKDGAYDERNRVVAWAARMALALGYKAGTARTAIEGWSEDWHGCVYIDTPAGQASWHFHDSQAHLFADLPAYRGVWDGHTTEAKYDRLHAVRYYAPARPAAADGEGHE